MDIYQWSHSISLRGSFGCIPPTWLRRRQNGTAECFCKPEWSRRKIATIEKPCGFKFEIHGVTYPNVGTDSSAINKKSSLLSLRRPFLNIDHALNHKVMKKFPPTKIWSQITTLQYKSSVAILGLMIISMAIGNLPIEMVIHTIDITPSYMNDLLCANCEKVHSWNFDISISKKL